MWSCRGGWAGILNQHGAHTSFRVTGTSPVPNKDCELQMDTSQPELSVSCSHPPSHPSPTCCGPAVSSGACACVQYVVCEELHVNICKHDSNTVQKMAVHRNVISLPSNRKLMSYLRIKLTPHGPSETSTCTTALPYCPCLTIQPHISVSTCVCLELKHKSKTVI